jgi:type IV secretory pathway protease TraF
MIVPSRRASHSGCMRRAWTVPCALLAALACGAGFVRAPDVLLYNGSPSVPVGFYLRSDEAPTLGDYVTVRAVEVAPRYAAKRDFADASDRFIKRVAARGGTTICASGALVHIGTRLTLARHAEDNAGRALPAWSGCRVLAADEIFLLGDTDDSFDSRYWGPVRTSEIDGVWRRLSLKPQRDSG